MNIKVFMVRMTYNDCNHDRIVETIADNFAPIAWNVRRSRMDASATIFAVLVRNPDSVDLLQKVLGTMQIIGDLAEVTTWVETVEL